MVSAEECNFNLLKHGCIEFCSNPSNNCSDDSNVYYCVGKYQQNKLDYPHVPDHENVPAECKCLLMGPVTPLEKKLDLVNHGNRACWSPHCRNGTSPKLDQLSKPSWWQDMQRCAAINFCTVNIENSNIHMYNDSLFVMDNCSEEEKIKSSGDDDLIPTGESAVDVSKYVDDSQNSEESTKNMKLLIGIIIIIFIFILIFISSRNKRLINNVKNISKK